MSGSRATAEDVARLAGVSRSTVSRALRNQPRVSARTRQRVREAAEQLRYHPNALASMLARGRTGTIGMAVPAFDRWYHSQVVAAAEEVFTAAGLDLLLYRVRTGEERAFLLDDTPFRNRVDGLLLVGFVPDDEEVQHLLTIGTATVTIGARSVSLPSVNVDDRAGASRMTEHLLELGHRSIGMLAGPIGTSERHQLLRDRLEGFEAAMTLAGATPFHVGGPIDYGGGIDGTIQLFSEHPEITAIVAASDEMAVGVIRAARELGLDVPQDLSVVGFDDHWLADALDLTTVNQSVPTHGTEGAIVLCQQLDDPQRDPRHILIPPRLLIRNSTAPPRGTTR